MLLQEIKQDKICHLFLLQNIDLAIPFIGSLQSIFKDQNQPQEELKALYYKKNENILSNLQSPLVLFGQNEDFFFATSVTEELKANSWKIMSIINDFDSCNHDELHQDFKYSIFFCFNKCLHFQQKIPLKLNNIVNQILNLKNNRKNFSIRDNHFSFDSNSRVLFYQSGSVRLLEKESLILDFYLNESFAKEKIKSQIFGYSDNSDTETVAVHSNSLIKKIRDGFVK